MTVAPALAQDQASPAAPSPIGVVVAQLPADAISIVIAGRAYYFHNGVFYLPAPGGYVVTGFLETPQVDGQAARSTPPSVGVDGRWLDRNELAHLFYLDLAGAILVERVFDGGAAERAGLRGGDVSALVNGDEILLGGDLIVRMEIPYPCEGVCLLDAPRHFAQLERVPVTLLRGGQLLTAVIEF